MCSLSDLPLGAPCPLVGYILPPKGGEVGGGGGSTSRSSSSSSSGIGIGALPGARSGSGWLAATVLSRAAEGDLSEEDGEELLWSLSVRDRDTHAGADTHRGGET